MRPPADCAGHQLICEATCENIFESLLFFAFLMCERRLETFSTFNRSASKLCHENKNLNRWTSWLERNKVEITFLVLFIYLNKLTRMKRLNPFSAVDPFGVVVWIIFILKKYS